MTLEHFDSLFAFVVIIAGVSLLVTTLTQLAAALLGLRGAHLQWGLKTLLANLDSSLEPHAEQISAAVLRHPLISDSSFSSLGPDKKGTLSAVGRLLDKFLGRWKLASAIRQEELIRTLTLLANSPPAGGAQPADDWKPALTAALKRCEPQAARVLLLAAPELQKLFPGDIAKADQLMARVTSAAGDLTGNLEQWFDSVMDRVSQRFALYMRLWTVLFSVVIAFALQLDAFRLFEQVSTDSELRARLVASAGALSQKADEIITTSSTNAPPAAYAEAMKQLSALHANQLTNVPGGFSDLAGGERWLTNQLRAANVTNPEPWLREYEALVPGARLSVAADNLHSLLTDKLKFQLIPNDYPETTAKFFTSTRLHFWGIAASAALLSLGAPFWFNLLKTLSNLRPILANKEDKKEDQKAKAGKES